MKLDLAELRTKIDQDELDTGSPRAQREAALKRSVVDAYERYLLARERHATESARLDEDVATQESGKPVVGHLDVRLRAHRREADYLDAIGPDLESFVAAVAAVYAEEPLPTQ